MVCQKNDWPEDRPTFIVNCTKQFTFTPEHWLKIKNFICDTADILILKKSGNNQIKLLKIIIS